MRVQAPNCKFSDWLDVDVLTCDDAYIPTKVGFVFSNIPIATIVLPSDKLPIDAPNASALNSKVSYKSNWYDCRVHRGNNERKMVEVFFREGDSIQHNCISGNTIPSDRVRGVRLFIPQSQGDEMGRRDGNSFYFTRKQLDTVILMAKKNRKNPNYIVFETIFTDDSGNAAGVHHTIYILVS